VDVVSRIVPCDRHHCVYASEQQRTEELQNQNLTALDVKLLSFVSKAYLLRMLHDVASFVYIEFPHISLLSSQ